MIWAGPVTEDIDREAFQRHVRGQFSAAARGHGETLDGFDDAAAALADIWARDLGRRPVPDGWVALLGARVLWALRERRAAWRMVVNWTGAASAGWYAPVVQRGGPSLTGGLALGAGILSPAHSAMHPDGASWRLQAERLRGGAGNLELAFRGRVRRVLEGGAEVWDHFGGQGLLVVRGRVDGMLTGFLEDLLDRIRHERGWKRSPDIARSLRLPS